MGSGWYSIVYVTRPVASRVDILEEVIRLTTARGWGGNKAPSPVPSCRYPVYLCLSECLSKWG